MSLELERPEVQFKIKFPHVRDRSGFMVLN